VRAEGLLRLTMGKMASKMMLWKGIYNMPEQKANMTVVQTQYLCDVCGIGHMIPIDKRFVKDGETMFPHQCNNCGHKANYDVSYPTINYIVK